MAQQRASIAAVPLLRAFLGTPYRRGVVALAVVTLAWRIWTVSRWSWQNDDWQHIERSISMPFWTYLFHEHSGHVVPGVFLVTDLMTKVAPLDFDAVILIISVACAANVLIWGRALERVTGGDLLGARPARHPGAVPGDGRSRCSGGRPRRWRSRSRSACGLMVVAACRWTALAPPSRPGVVRPRLPLGLFFWQKAVLLTVPAAFALLALAEGSLRQRCAGSWPRSPRWSRSRSPTSPCSGTSRSAPGELRHRARRRGHLVLRGRAATTPTGSRTCSCRHCSAGRGEACRPTASPSAEPAPAVTTIVLVVCALGLALAWPCGSRARCGCCSSR